MTSEAYDSLQIVGEIRSWGRALYTPLILHSLGPIYCGMPFRAKFLLALRPIRGGMFFSSKCSLYGKPEETFTHIFLSFHFIGEVQEPLGSFFG